MKHLIFISLALMGSVASANVIVNHSNKASPATVVAKNFEKAVGEGTIDFYQAGNCEEAEQKFSSSKNAVMTYNADVGIAALSKNLACPLKATADKTVFIGKSYLKICTNAKNPKQLNQSKTIGAASVILSKGLIEDYNSNGLKLKGVPYGGSKDVLGAVVAGDIDFGFIASGIADPAVAQGQIVCPLTTDPRSKEYVGNVYKLKIPGMPIAKVFYTNSNDKVLIEKLRTAAESKDFQEYLKKSGYSDVKTRNITAQDIDGVQKHINDSYNLYWK